MRKTLGHRPDLVRRFVEGEFGFQQIGAAVTPQWDDKLHLATGLTPLPRQDLFLLWDWGHNPTCIISQRTPLGQWLILDAMVGDGLGAQELVEQAVKPLLVERYGFSKDKQPHVIRHIGDPAGKQKEQTSILNSAVRLVKKELGGSWRSGPVKLEHRLEPLRAVLTRTHSGRGIVQVDRRRASEVWQALRGGWHFNISRTGITSTVPVKDMHSHPGDAMSYGAAVLYPMGRLNEKMKFDIERAQASYFGRKDPFNSSFKGDRMPEHDETLNTRSR